MITLYIETFRKNPKIFFKYNLHFFLIQKINLFFFRNNIIEEKNWKNETELVIRNILIFLKLLKSKIHQYDQFLDFKLLYIKICENIFQLQYKKKIVFFILNSLEINNQKFFFEFFEKNINFDFWILNDLFEGIFEKEIFHFILKNLKKIENDFYIIYNIIKWINFFQKFPKLENNFIFISSKIKNILSSLINNKKIQLNIILDFLSKNKFIFTKIDFTFLIYLICIPKITFQIINNNSEQIENLHLLSKIIKKKNFYLLFDEIFEIVKFNNNEILFEKLKLVYNKEFDYN